MSPILDRRITPARPDLAARHLMGQVEARAFADPEPMRVVAPSAPVRREPRPDAPSTPRRSPAKLVAGL